MYGRGQPWCLGDNGRFQAYFLLFAGVILRPGPHALGGGGVSSLDMERDAPLFTRESFEIEIFFIAEAAFLVDCFGRLLSAGSPCKHPDSIGIDVSG